MFTTAVHRAMRDAIEDLSAFVGAESALVEIKMRNGDVAGVVRYAESLGAASTARDLLEDRCEAMFGPFALDPSCFCHMPGECPACLHEG